MRFDNGAAGFCFGNIDTSNGYDAYHSIRGDRGELIFDGRLDHAQKVRFCSTSVADGRWIYPLDDARCRRDGVDPWPSDTTTPDSGDVIQHQTRECIRHFVECARSRVKSPLSFSNTAVIAEVGWAALMSSACGREIPIPLDRAAAARFFDSGLCPGGCAS